MKKLEMKIVLALTLAVIGTAFLSPVQGFADDSATEVSPSTAVEATEESSTTEEVVPAAIINSDESSEDLEDSSSSFED